jgi:ubiquinone/menaquinone biosynthesis C-methylase UbiE
MDSSKIQEIHYANKLNENYTPLKEMRIIKSQKIFSKLKKGKKVLDVGCADGEILKPFTADFDIHGVDISPFFVSKARSSGIKARVWDLEKKPLPYKDKEFDIVYTGETIEHVVDTDWFLSEINRVLKKNGLLIITSPNIRSLTSILMMLLLDLPPQFSARYGSPHYRDFTLKTLKQALGFHHFKVESAIGSDFYLPLVHDFGAWLAEHLPSWSKTMIISAKKTKDSNYDSAETLKFNLHQD